AAALAGPGPGPGRAEAAADLELSITSVASGRAVLRRAVRLSAGEEAHFEQKGLRLKDRPQPVDVHFAVTLRDEGRDAITVEVHGILRDPGAATPLAWSARTYTLRPGEAAALVVAPERAAGVELAVRAAGGDVGTDETPAVRLTVTLRV